MCTACDRYGDTFGVWEDSAAVQNDTLMFDDYEKHFFGGGPGEALDFTQIWVPNNCSYHRFTNATIHKCVDYIMKNNMGSLPEHKVRIVFIGDSATRGIFCGIGRILSGSEVYGPNINSVCGGGPYGNPVTTSSFGVYHDVEFGNLTLSFVYVKNFNTRHLDWIIEYAVTVIKPYAVVMNTGAWDFDNVARSHPNQTATEECSTEETQRIAENRASPQVNATMWELGHAAVNSGVRAIYRNNHHNVR